MAPQTRSQKPGTSTSEGKKVAARGAKRKEAEAEVEKAESSARGARRQSDKKPAVEAAGAASASKGKQPAPKGKSKAKGKGTPMGSFRYELDWKRIDARKHPCLYRPGRVSVLPAPRSATADTAIAGRAGSLCGAAIQGGVVAALGVQGPRHCDAQLAGPRGGL